MITLLARSSTVEKQTVFAPYVLSSISVKRHRKRQNEIHSLIDI